MLLFWKLVDETQMPKPPEATLIQKNVDPSTPQSFNFIRFNMKHPAYEQG